MLRHWEIESSLSTIETAIRELWFSADSTRRRGRQAQFQPLFPMKNQLKDFKNARGPGDFRNTVCSK
jgi:hypothetical protein